MTRLPANRFLGNSVGSRRKSPAGGRPHGVRRYYASFSYQGRSWNKPRRVAAKVEWHPGELYPRVGFIVTNLARPYRAGRRLLQPARHGGAVDQGRQERDQMDPAVLPDPLRQRMRLQLPVLAYHLGNFMRTLAMPKTAQPWSLTS